MSKSDPVVTVEKAEKVYKSGDTTITALASTDLEIYPNELTLIVGPSGSGKTTLLSLIGCVIYPTKGDIIIFGDHVSKLKEKELAKLRLQKIGFVFQEANLLEPLTALLNVMQPLTLNGVKRSEAKKKAMKALDQVGLKDRAGNLPRSLSGGQKQRVAIARALVNDPVLVLCDEPTASIDVKSAVKVMEDLKALAEDGKSVSVVTHDTRLEKYADRILYVSEGKVSDKPIESEIE